MYIQSPSRLPRQGLEHRRFPGVDIVEISDGRVDLAGVFEGVVERLELPGRAHFVDGVVYGRYRGKRSIDGNGMRRQPDAASIGRLLELGGARGLIRDDG